MDRDDTILDYLQGRLAPEDRARFEAALVTDASLAAEVDVMRAVREDLAAGPRHEQAEAVWEKLAAAIDAPPIAANQNRAPWLQLARYAAVAVVAVVSWQVAVAPLITGAPPLYRAATESADGLVLQVRFADDATMAQITALLTELNGTIADGPSALGLVRVAFGDEAARQEALDVLGRRPALVDLVQVP
jgi:anti-sigma factor RsiW